jgi:hypothetical protein
MAIVYDLSKLYRGVVGYRRGKNTRRNRAVYPGEVRHLRKNEGTTDGYEAGTRLIPNPKTHFDVEFELFGKLDQSGTYIAQNIGGLELQREFQLYTSIGLFKLILGGVINATTIPINPGIWRFIFDGAELNVFRNGFLVDTRNPTVGNVTESTATTTMCMRHEGNNETYSNHLAGVMANVIFRGPSEELIAKYKINDNETVIANQATVLGSEKVLNPNFNTNSGWSLNPNHVITGGQLVITGAGAFSHSKQIVDVSAGKTQRLSINYDDPQSNVKVNIFDGDNTGEIRIVSKALDDLGGSYDFYFTPSTDKVLIYVETLNVDQYIAFNYISLKEADKYAKVINPNLEDWNLYIRDRIVKESRYYRGNEGTTDGYESGERLIPDPRIHFDVEFELVGSVDKTGTFVAQNVVDNAGEREFQIYQNNDAVDIYIGGTLNSMETTLTEGVWRIKFDGTEVSIYKSNVLIETAIANIGDVLESNATFTVAARHNGSISSYGFNYEGVIANVKIRNSNGELIHGYEIKSNSSNIPDTEGIHDLTVKNGNANDWYIADKIGGSYVGPDIITQDVWENPYDVEDQWTFANNKWTLTGDGSLNVLNILPFSAQPNVFRLGTTINSLSGDPLAVNNTTSADYEKSEAGYYIDTLNKDVSGSQLYKRSSGVTSATISKPTMKEVLD